MRTLLPASLFLLSAPALAATFTFDGPCLPDPIVLPIDEAVVTADDATVAVWSIEPVDTAIGTFEAVVLENDNAVGDRLTMASDFGDIMLEGPTTTVDSNGIPQSLALADWSLDARYSGAFGNCVLSAASSSFVDGVLTYTFGGSCLPDPLVIPLASPELGLNDATEMTWSFDPIATSAGNFSALYVMDEPSFDMLRFSSDLGDIILVGPEGTNLGTSFPTSLELADWSFEALFDGAAGTCGLTTVTTSTGSDLVQDTIGSTSGFGSVLDSGPANLSSTVIESRLSSLEDDQVGCTTERWAGTWVRGRSPRLSGETESGSAISGASITNGTVDSTPFSASLASGGRIVGSTDSGSSLEGWFTRIDSSKAIWYGVETSCP